MSDTKPKQKYYLTDLADNIPETNNDKNEKQEKMPVGQVLDSDSKTVELDEKPQATKPVKGNNK